MNQHCPPIADVIAIAQPAASVDSAGLAPASARAPMDRLRQLLGVRPHRTCACVLLSLRDVWLRLSARPVE